MTVVDVSAGLSREAVERLSAAKNEPAWMRDRRLEAWDVFAALPMPTRQDEAWRYTDLRRLKLDRLTPFPDASGPGVESPLRLDGGDGTHAAGIVKHHNSVTVQTSLQDDLAAQGVILTDLETAVREHPDLVRRHFMTEAVRPDHDKFTALNAAFWSGGTFLYVPRGVEVSLPLRTLYTLTAPSAGIFTHTLMVLEPTSRVTYVEEYASGFVDQPQVEAGGRLSLNAGVVEVLLGQAAHLTLVTLQEWTGDVFDLSTQRAVMQRDSQLDWLVIGMGSGVTRSNIETGLVGPGASTQMLGVLWGYGSQHTDYHTVQDHVAPNTTSDLLYKAALRDEATSVFTGTIRVAKGAQRTDAYQANRNVLLSEHAAAFPSPNLEIEANEVRCTHGASVGKVDQDQLFYLMSRGLPKELATRMVVEGFFEEVLQREPVQSIRDNLRDLIDRKLSVG